MNPDVNIQIAHPVWEQILKKQTIRNKHLRTVAIRTACHPSFQLCNECAMKIKIIIATLLYTTGFLQLMDWVVYATKNDDLATQDYAQFKRNFVIRFPESIQPLFSTYGNLTTTVLIAFFIIAGVIFLKERKTVLKLIGITAFAFAFWNLFSLM
jgi:hypothetical protein